MKQKNNGGYSLIEILIAIAVLGIVTIPATTSLLTAHRVNVQAEKMLTAQLQVSSAVETLMAEGIDRVYNDEEVATCPGVKITAVKETEVGAGAVLPYYKVTVKSDDSELESVFVTTYIREVPTEVGGG